MVYILAKSIFQLNNYNIYDAVLKIIGSSIIIVVLYFIGKISEKKIADKLQFIEKKYIALFLFVLIVDSTIVSILGDFVLNVYVSKNQFLFEFFYILVVVGIFFQLALVVALILSRNAYREKEALAKQYLNDQKKHYEYLKHRERETRKFRHDIKNHMYLLNNMYTQGNLEEFHTYMEQINQKIISFGNPINLNNKIADAIFNKFYYEGKKQGILFNIEGHFPVECNIPTFDLCTILSNLLSNAMHAQAECQSGTIDVSIRYTNREITIKIKNQYLQEPLQSEGIFQTRKMDKENHGFGLENVRECVENNHGHIVIETGNNHFEVILSLHNELHKDTTEGIEYHENSNCR
ncbi:MAG: GHKL domain-containing protein [Lachnospiraceae bacterium]|nr:GHKL domain-containing protein [Lachnospiraceae bacterium]